MRADEVQSEARQAEPGLGVGPKSGCDPHQLDESHSGIGGVPRKGGCILPNWVPNSSQYAKAEQIS